MIQSRLLDIALSEFGLKGLEGASTRGIAKAAGTAMSSITYHYGGKEGLYLAVADHIAARMAEDMGDVLDTGTSPPTDDPAVARARIQAALARFVDKMAGDRNSDWGLFVIREQMRPTEAFDRIYGGVMGQMLELLSGLIVVATGMTDRRAARIVTITLMGQVVALRGSRSTCLRLLERDEIADDDLVLIKTRIAANIDAILDRLRAEQQGLS